MLSYKTLTKPLHSFETLNAASGGELVLVEAEINVLQDIEIDLRS